MRNLFLTLVLANIFMLAWQFWVQPESAELPAGASGLALAGMASGSLRDAGISGERRLDCLRLGPLADVAAMQRTRTLLLNRGIAAAPIAQNGQVWVGHWVHIGGFAAADQAELARQRLVSSGLVDAYLMQEEAESMISLGVFRDRERADRVARVARDLGFEVAMRDRFKPGVENWLLVRPRPGQSIGPRDLTLGDDLILRSEPSACPPP